VTEIFPEGHPLRQALRLEGDALRETTAETELKTASGIRRVGVSVQGIQENGETDGSAGYAARPGFTGKHQYTIAGERAAGSAGPQSRQVWAHEVKKSAEFDAACGWKI